MADLDAELLALAGDDSEGEESVASSRQEKSSSPVEKEPTPPRASRKPVSRGIQKGRKRRNYSDDEDDDMSASEGSVSAPMSQSESEAEFESEKPRFPYEKLYFDAADKAAIDAKPEIEREAILAERTEEIEKEEQNAQLRRIVLARTKEEQKQSKKKRKASAADLDENQRKSSRQRNRVGGDTETAINKYRKQREEKAALEERRKQGKPEPRRDSLRDDYSDADAEGESDNDYKYDDRKRRRQSPSPPPKDDPVAELQDIQRVRVGRENFAQVCYTPGFDEAIKGCYARVCLGPGRNPGQNEYRLCTIKGFEEGKPYAMEGPNGKQMLVRNYILAAHGKAEKKWSFLECSNSRFTDDEWRRYRLTMANEDQRMPTKGQINAKLEQINKLIAHRFTDFEISQKLKKQKDLVDYVNRTDERRSIKEQILAAEDRGDEEEVKNLEEKLFNLVPHKLAMGTTLNHSTTQKANHEADRLAELNRHHKKLQTESMQKAAMLKRRAYKKMQSGPDKDKLAPPSQVKSLDDDLFGSASDMSRAGTPVNGSRAGTPMRNGSEAPRSSTPLSMRTGGELKKGLPVIKKTKRDDEVLAGMDLGIDIDI